MTIGELVKASGTSARSIRHYEAAGLFTARRLPNGYRDFDHAGITTVKQIGLLLQLGFPIKSIRELAPCFPDSAKAIAVCPKIRAALVDHQARLKTRHAQLGKLLRKIDAVISASSDQVSF